MPQKVDKGEDLLWGSYGGAEFEKPAEGQYYECAVSNIKPIEGKHGLCLQITFEVMMGDYEGAWISYLTSFPNAQFSERSRLGKLVAFLNPDFDFESLKSGKRVSMKELLVGKFARVAPSITADGYCNAKDIVASGLSTQEKAQLWKAHLEGGNFPEKATETDTFLGAVNGESEKPAKPFLQESKKETTEGINWDELDAAF